MKLTEAAIDDFTPASGKESAIAFDSQVTGLGLKATSKGSKIFLFQYWSGARTHRITLGRYGDITLAEARRLAAAMRLKVAAGGSPSEDRKQRIDAEKKHAEKSALTLEVLIGQWEALKLRDRSSSYKAEATRALRRAYATKLQQPAEHLSSTDVQATLDGIASRHATTARRVRAYTRAMFGWAVKRGMVPLNPCDAVVVEGREVERDRVLSDVELGEVWRAAGKLGAIPAGFVRLSLLTLQRRNEVAGMCWSELAADLSTWTVPAVRAKNRRAHVVHLAPAARAILSELPRIAGTDLVFATQARADPATIVPLSGFSDVWTRLQVAIRAEREGAPRPRRKKGMGGYKRAEVVTDWTPHDFRRTGVTVLAGQGVAPHVADRLLNHVQGTIRGVAAVYQRNEFLAERKTALELWASYVLVAAGVAEPKGPRRRRRPQGLRGIDLARIRDE